MRTSPFLSYNLIYPNQKVDMIIAQNFLKLSKKIIFSLKNKEIKAIIGRDRLKFTYQEVFEYVQIIFEHTLTHRTFKSIYKKSKLEFTYQGFMKNIQLFSRLFKFLFNKINEELSIKSSKFLNIVDTTLIEEKKVDFINQKDWDSGRVTARINKNNKNNNNKINKVYTCGSKGLIFLNRFGQIYSANLLPINFSDQNILKDHTYYLKELKGIILADKGFNNKAARERLNHIQTSIFQTNKPVCRLISPYHYKEKNKLTDKERRIYKHRWKIETIFQKIKHNYSETKLNLTGNYSRNNKGAKFYSTLIQYNLNLLP